QAAERKAQEIELCRGGGEEEIALVAAQVPWAEQRAMAADVARAHIMPGRHGGGAELRCRCKKVGELDGLIAGNAGDRRLPAGIALGEGIDHRAAEARLVVENVMRDPELRGHLARVVD